MRTTQKYDSEALSRLVGVVRELHAKSSERWSRANLELSTGGTAWVVGHFGLSVGEVVTCDATFDAKFKSYTIKNLITDDVAVVSNGIIYLKLIETLDGVGKTKAAKLCENYPNLFQALQDDPDNIAKLVGIPVERVIEVSDQLKAEKNNLNRLTILEKKGWPSNLAKKVAKSDKLYKIAIDSPYEAIEHVEGLGWKIADKIGLSQGIADDDPKRIKAAVEFYYNDHVANDGHTKVFFLDIVKGVSDLLNIDDYEPCIHEGIASTLLDLGDNWFTNEKHSKNSHTIASFFLQSSTSKKYTIDFTE